MEAPDLNEQLFIVGQTGSEQIKREYTGNMSKEERIKLAEEKIKAAKVRREEEKKVNDHESEISRIKGGKDATKARREWEEQEKFHAI